MRDKRHRRHAIYSGIRATDRLWYLRTKWCNGAYISQKTLREVVRLGGLCVYDVVKTATPKSTITSDALAIGGIIFITFGLGGLPSLDCFVK